MTARNNADPDQLALLEPCLVCLRLTIGPNSGVVGVWGAEDHRGCYIAAQRWWPYEAAVSRAARAEAEAQASLREAAAP